MDLHRAAGGRGHLQQKRIRHDCVHCQRPFLVTFEAEPDEPEERAPVACPHCWRIDHVMVARSARWGNDYQADRAEAS